MHFLTLDDIDVDGRRVLVRADLNVPVADGVVTDTTRITRAAATVRDLLDRRAAVIVLSHFGRPKGAPDAALSLRPIVGPLADAVGVPVAFADDCVGPAAEAAVAALGPGEVVLLENVRFHAGEESNDPGFAAALARLGEVYVNDAFSASHRAHASIEGVARLLPAAAGRLMTAELDALESALGSPARPLAAVVGGAKVSTKLDVLQHLVGKVDSLMIGGAMANTFLHARGIDVGRSLCEADLADTARAVMAAAEAGGCTLLLPDDAVISTALEAGAEASTVPVTAVPPDAVMLDVGAATVRRYCAAIEQTATLVWNGPLGAFETPPFDQGTCAVARAAAAATRQGRLTSVAGGGDTVAALNAAGVVDDFSYVSTAGGAFLEWLEGKELPGIAALHAAAGDAP